MYMISTIMYHHAGPFWARLVGESRIKHSSCRFTTTFLTSELTNDPHVLFTQEIRVILASRHQT